MKDDPNDPLTQRPSSKSEVHTYYWYYTYYITAGHEVVREDCQARKLNKEDAMDRCKWRKMIKEAR